MLTLQWGPGFNVKKVCLVDFFYVLNSIPVEVLKILSIYNIDGTSFWRDISDLSNEIYDLLQQGLELDKIQELVQWNILMRQHNYDENNQYSNQNLFLYWLEDTINNYERCNLKWSFIQMRVEWFYLNERIDFQQDLWIFDGELRDELIIELLRVVELLQRRFPEITFWKIVKHLLQKSDKNLSLIEKQNFSKITTFRQLRGILNWWNSLNIHFSLKV